MVRRRKVQAVNIGKVSKELTKSGDEDIAEEKDKIMSDDDESCGSNQNV